MSFTVVVKFEFILLPIEYSQHVRSKIPVGKTKGVIEDIQGGLIQYKLPVLACTLGYTHFNKIYRQQMQWHIYVFITRIPFLQQMLEVYSPQDYKHVKYVIYNLLFY